MKWGRVDGWREREMGEKKRIRSEPSRTNKRIRKERGRKKITTQACKNVRIRSRKGKWNVHLSKMTEVLKRETKVALRCQK